MNFFKRLFKIFDKRLTHISDVKPGTYFYIEWSAVEGGIGYVKCLNNDPKVEKIIVLIEWGQLDGSILYERYIWSYDDDKFKMFRLLNSSDITIPNPPELPETLDDLKYKLELAIDNENYELATKLRNKINKLEEGE